MRVRSAFAIQRDVVFAIFIREMNSRFATYSFGNAWLLVEPLLMMAIFITLFGFRGIQTFANLEPAVFIMISFVPFRLLWNGTMRQNMAAANAKGLLGFRQVRLFDIYLARSLIEAGVYLVVATLLTAILLWFDFDAIPDDPIRVLGYAAVLWLFAASFGILASMLSSIAKEVEKAIAILTLPLMIASAVIYPMTIVPPSYYIYFEYNPLVHAVELLRESWVENYESPIADSSFLISCTFVLMAVSIAAYRLYWRRVVAS
jgi:capsular polysaccharide transport system permease protein